MKNLFKYTTGALTAVALATSAQAGTPSKETSPVTGVSNTNGNTNNNGNRNDNTNNNANRNANTNNNGNRNDNTNNNANRNANTNNNGNRNDNTNNNANRNQQGQSQGQYVVTQAGAESQSTSTSGIQTGAVNSGNKIVNEAADIPAVTGHVALVLGAETDVDNQEHTYDINVAGFVNFSSRCHRGRDVKTVDEAVEERLSDHAEYHYEYTTDERKKEIRSTITHEYMLKTHCGQVKDFEAATIAGYNAELQTIASDSAEKQQAIIGAAKITTGTAIAQNCDASAASLNNMFGLAGAPSSNVQCTPTTVIYETQPSYAGPYAGPVVVQCGPNETLQKVTLAGAPEGEEPVYQCVPDM